MLTSSMLHEKWLVKRNAGHRKKYRSYKPKFKRRMIMRSVIHDAAVQTPQNKHVVVNQEGNEKSFLISCQSLNYKKFPAFCKTPSFVFVQHNSPITGFYAVI